MTRKENDQSNDGSEFEKVKLTYETLSNKRIAYDQLMWQTPVICITAQAFLFTIAFETEQKLGVQIVAIFLSSIIGLASAQLLYKHRQHEKKSSIELQNIVLVSKISDPNTNHPGSACGCV